MDDVGNHVVIQCVSPMVDEYMALILIIFGTIAYA